MRQRLPIGGSHFRRQIALGPYGADFCCLSARLIVEVDGGQHSLDHQAAYDDARTAALERQGFRVLRFTNPEVMQRIDSVLDTILATLTNASSFTRQPGGATPTSNSSPQGGGAFAEPPHGRHL